MTHPARLIAALLLAPALAYGVVRPETPAAKPPLLLGETYPLEVSTAFPAALLHWLDSLAQLSGPGMTAGKTVGAHRSTYRSELGEPTADDLRRMREYRDVRVASAKQDRVGLTRAFLEAPDLGAALARARTILDESRAEAFSEAVRHFENKYRGIWNDGEVPRDFLVACRGEERLDALARLLVDIAAFYGVDPTAAAPPRLILTPVRDGFGTHAQAVGRFLLIEVRPGEGLLDQVAPIVHENAHFLFHGMDPERIAALNAVALAHGPGGGQAWRSLEEALPTALAQGFAVAKFHPQRFSFDERWYHVEAIDAYAKRIFPIVKRALPQGRSLDESLVEELIAVYPAATRRSP